MNPISIKGPIQIIRNKVNGLFSSNGNSEETLRHVLWVMGMYKQCSQENNWGETALSCNCKIPTTAHH